ncbi:hypothetical protein PY093_17930 [Cytobacillus sp. S13-E01]|uniref:hypothetical protein n=1 Tax=Cytobacillus sp. S13-E01 TaxID=3031326 RepID=UPI0023D7FAF9|nr:hypothetical protein [Cytobacillus sp. S13-E01]MDF0728518.1 hypothetical protein [Cytobacillus sp. S13-E01]
METFGRGCLYCILGVVVLLFFAFVTQSTIQLPWIIFIPLVLLAFWAASKKNKNH